MKNIFVKFCHRTGGVLRYFWRSKRSEERIRTEQAQQAFLERLLTEQERTANLLHLYGRTLSNQVSELEELVLKVVAIQSGIASTIEKDYKPTASKTILDNLN